MPEYLAPGVYVEEIEIGAKPIEGVSTSTVGMIGVAKRGPLNKPALITGFAEFQRIFGGTESKETFLSKDWGKHRYLPYAVYGFFINAGKRCYVTRIAGAGCGTARAKRGIGGQDIQFVASHPLQVEAKGPDDKVVESPGEWGDSLTIDLEKGSLNLLKPSVFKFNLTGDGTNTEFIISSDLAKENISIEIDRIETTDWKYDVTKGTITFTAAPASGSKIVVTYVPALLLKPQNYIFTFTGDGATTDFIIPAELDENKIIVELNGVFQTTGYSYDSSSGKISFDSAPGNVEIKITYGPPYTFIFSGDGSTIEFTILSGLNVNYIKVEVDGAIQDPETAYSYNPSTGVISFTVAPPLGDKNVKDTYTPPIPKVPKTYITKFSGNGTATDFILATGLDEKGIRATVSGEHPGPYTYESHTGIIHFESAPPSGTDNIEVECTPPLVSVPSKYTFEHTGDGSKRDFIIAKDLVSQLIDVEVDGTKMNLDKDFTYNSATGVLNFITEDPPTGSVETTYELKDYLFKLVVKYKGNVVETFDNLSMDSTSKENYFVKRINKTSGYVHAKDFRSDTTSDGTPTLPTKDVKFSGGGDGSKDLKDSHYIGKDNGPNNRTGLKAFVDVNEVRILAAPGQTSPNVVLELIGQCENLKDRFAIFDSEEEATINLVKDYKNRFDSKYAALYYPWIKIYDPLTDDNIFVPPSGHMAGVYARSDTERGVHKDPANEIIKSAVGLKVDLSKGDQEILNPIGINCTRAFPGRGIRIWGGRTISSDTLWKYINVRRLFIFLEKSIEEGTQWVVFEPNDEKLWARVRQTITQFLTRVWKDGALMGTTPEEAFFVKCDRTTMTQDDIDNGRLIVLIGVAPVKPAEFVIFRIAQWTGGSAVTE